MRSALCLNSTTGTELPRYRCGKMPEISEPCNTQSCDQKCKIALEQRVQCAPYFEDPRSGYFSESIRKATCQEYGCCWANDAVSRGYQCYKDRSDILDGAGLGCLVDKPPGCDTFEEYNQRRVM